MKRTTYIFMGILISGLVVIIAGMYFISLTGEDRNGRGITFPSECKKMDLEGIRVVKIYTTQAEVVPRKRIMTVGTLSVTPAGESVKSSLSYPDTKHLHATKKGDTLFVELDFNLYDLPERIKAEDYFFVNNVFLNLVADSTLTYIYNDASSLVVASKGMSLNSLAVRSCGSVQLDSCDIRTFDLAGNDVRFAANNSRINDFYLDLDGIRAWNFNQCTVDTEHLTGNDRHTTDLQRRECRQVLWTPKSETAKLVVTFTQKASMLLQE